MVVTILFFFNNLIQYGVGIRVFALLNFEEVILIVTGFFVAISVADRDLGGRDKQGQKLNVRRQKRHQK